MNPKNRLLIQELLAEGGPITAAVLARKISVSPRTVMNYIAEINFYQPGLIESSQKGYTLDIVGYRQIARQTLVFLPQNAAERINALLQKLLLTPPKPPGLDLPAFAEEICVSLETVRKDLLPLRHKLAHFQLQAEICTNYLQLQGKETTMRNLLSWVLYDSFHQTKLSADTLQKIFPQADIPFFYRLLQDECRQYPFFINDCLLLNLIQDLLVVLCRIQQGCCLPAKPAAAGKSGQTTAIAAFTNNLAQKLAEHYQLSLPASEILYLQEILLGYLLPADFATLTVQTVIARLPVERQTILQELFQRMQRHFSFLEFSQKFCVNFTLNLNNLLHRCQSGRRSCNPQKNDMKSASPFAFQCAVSIAQELEDLCGVQLLEEDIAYLALHISLNLADQRDPDLEKINCGLLITPYFNYDKDLRQKLAQRLQNDILITAEANSERELTALQDTQLILSTVPLPADYPVDWATTDPLLSTSVLAHIQKRIAAKKAEKKQRILRNQLQQLLPASCFLYNTAQQQYNTPEAIFARMLHTLTENGFLRAPDITAVAVHKNHPTLFGYIATANLLVKNIKRSGLVVVLNEKPPLWQGTPVDLVLLLALQPKDWELIQYSFDLLIHTLLENELQPSLRQIRSAGQFIDLLCQSIPTQID